MNQALNPITMPLHGTSLIEASAGTGKTFNIAALFARLVLLERLPVDAILVVTFTKAATAELKTRLRTRLNQALALLQNNLPPQQNDPVLQQLIDTARTQDDDTNLILRLQAAITQFDRAAVYTIHGFCQRVLTDYAFLCQTPFDTETIDTDPELLCRFAEDFWRRQVSNNSRMATLAVANKLTPARLMQEMGRYCGVADLQLRQPPGVDMATINASWQQAWQTVCTHFNSIQDAFWQLYPQLNGKSYVQKSYQQLFCELQQAMDNSASYQVFSATTLERCAKLAAAQLHEKTKKNQILNDELVAKVATLAELATAVSAMQAADNSIVLQLQLDCFNYVRQCLQEHRRNSHQRSYDDLLADVGMALSADNPMAETLAAALAQTWQIALVDECQDTDPLQYRIFKTAFATQNRPLIMVGDPKQAIYRFRGADIHAYLRAAADTPAEQRYTLTTNYRSHQALVQAIGHLFSGKQLPFILEGIDYPPVQAQETDNHLHTSQNNIVVPAVVVRWLPEQIEVNDKGEEIIPNKDSLRIRAAECCAYEIADMINQGKRGELQLGNRSLQAGDIAVLVHSHNEGSMIASTLKRCGIISVSLGNQSVFASTEAQAVMALLRFCLQPQRTETLRFILGGVLFGWTAAQLAELNQNENTLSKWIQLALQTREQWYQYGIYTAMQWFASQTGMETRLLSQRNERSLTNLWQLAELLADAEQTLPTANALLGWLASAISNERPANENYLLRLESDEALVKIVTMHASKGLEYPVVFCPFAWDGRQAVRNQEHWQLLHQKDNVELIANDLLSDSDREELARESMAESLRLYYVAFTRAREQLILYTAACNSTATNPMAWLLDGQPDNTLEESQIYWQQTHKKHLPSTLRAAWQTCLANSSPALFHWCEGSVAPSSVHPQSTPNQPYHALTLTTRPFHTIRYTSFTSLSRHDYRHHEHSLEEEKLAPALDQAEVQVQPLDTSTEAETALLAFERGINAGLCLHAILEQTEFSQPASAAEQEHIQDCLTRYGFDCQHSTTMQTLTDAVRQCSLSARTTIASLPVKQRVAEMNFMLHIADFNIADLQQWFACAPGLPECCIQAAQELDFATVNGFINGAIDLLGEDIHGQVYVIDYKSNHLGNRLADYAPENMDIAIAKHHYYLQALIYSIACARFLYSRQQLPDYISVRYLFLRGLNPHNQHGIWQWDIKTHSLMPWLVEHDKT
ncbi:exodeoxyribonuclease V subunit beta [Snodgrassella communis]|uniref:exodeoxyribonuclease V subunit beta n=1 Tax=Snodgrassella communis TaxID=2946699 RepID=UPI001EF64B0B|nr:exodeoxyribonuclease V subunit beta [Snodgrassella communis]